MSETVQPYSPALFPHAEILGGLTDTIRDQGMPPMEAFLAFSDARRAMGLKGPYDYGSTSITTGGHARLPGKRMSEVIESNTNTARQIVSLLHHSKQVIGKEMVLSVDLGNTGWSQSQYMSFWLFVNAGPDLSPLSNNEQGLSGFEQGLEKAISRYVDLDVMNDGSLGREERRPHYGNFAQTHAFVFTDGTVDLKGTTHRHVELVDNDLSLGCWTEGRFASILGIERFKVAPVAPADIYEAAAPIPTLEHDLHILLAAGVVATVAARGSMLILVGDGRPVENYDELE